MVRTGGTGTKRKSNALLDSDSNSHSGSSSEPEKVAKKKKGVTKKKASEIFTESSDSDSDWASGSKTKKSKKKKTPNNKKSLRPSHSGSDDNNEDNSEAESSIISKPLSSLNDSTKKSAGSDLEEGEVSTSLSESEESEFNDGFDNDFMGDDEDRLRLSLMTEKEREQEIYKRAERRDTMKARFEIEKKLKQAKRKELKKQKSGGESGTKDFKMDAKERSKERKKTVEGKVDKKSQAMDQLKAEREARKEREREKEKLRIEMEKRKEDGEEIEDSSLPTPLGDKGTKKKLKASDIYSDDSGSDWESKETSINKVKRVESTSSSSSDSEDEDRKPVFISTAKELNRIRLSRQKIEKWVHYPFFENLAKGTFVRLGIGINPKEQISIYRIAEVLEVVATPKIYTLGSTRTNKGFKLRHGRNEKTFRLEFLSTQEFTESEFEKWKAQCYEDDVALPTIADVESKEREIREATSYQFKDSDVDHIIQEKQKFKQSPVNYAVRKTQLMKEKETAQSKNDEARVEEITRELAELDDRAKQLDKARSMSIQSISYINERNRKKNVEQAEKAIMEEIKASKGLKVQDPFTRRNTKPMPMVVNRQNVTPAPPLFTPDSLKNDSFDTSLNTTKISTDSVDGPAKESKEGQEGQDETEMDSSEHLDLSTSFTEGDEKIELPQALLEMSDTPKILSTGDLFAAHDFDIQLELDTKLPPTLPIVARPSVPQIRDPTPKRSLNLDDYKRKRGLI